MSLNLVSRLKRQQTLAAGGRDKVLMSKKLPPPIKVFTLMRRVVAAFQKPVHFKSYIKALKNSVGQGLRLVFAAPPQHGKTECTLATLVHLVCKHPGLHHAYMTYSVDRAREVSKHFCTILAAAGVPFTGNLNVVYFPGGGSIRFTSADKGLNGSPVNGVFIVDDFYRDQAMADSPAMRKSREIAWRGSVVPRLHPGASVIILATRWHPQDMSGVLIEEGYVSIVLAAIAEEGDPLGREIGEALWPSLRPLAFLEKQREAQGPTAFNAMYQGRPRVRGAGVFRRPSYYSVLPTVGFIGSFGVDLAYTESTSADESVIAEMWRQETSDPDKPNYYVVYVRASQVEVPEFAEELKAKHAEQPMWSMCWRASGTERGSAQLLKVKPYSLPLVIKTPPGDKLVSSRKLAIAWNSGRVMFPDAKTFPEHSKWVVKTINQALDFTGSGKERDDIVDALGNAHVMLEGERSSSGVVTAKSSR